jgi:hypothetical protein
MPKKLPKHIMFGHRRYAIIASADQPDDTHGHFSSFKRKIIIGAEDDKVEQVDTLIHELVHLIMFEGAIKVDDDMEERIATLVGTGLTQMLKRNPSLLAWIAENLRRG